MKKHISIILAMAVGAALLAACTPGAFAQSIGVNFTSDGNDSGIAGVNNAATNTDSSMLPTDLAGAAPYAQMNWNNLGKYGGVNPAVLTNSAGNTVSLEINWDSGGAATTGTSAGLGTPDGKLMDGFLYS